MDVDILARTQLEATSDTHKDTYLRT